MFPYCVYSVTLGLLICLFDIVWLFFHIEFMVTNSDLYIFEELNKNMFQSMGKPELTDIFAFHSILFWWNPVYSTDTHMGIVERHSSQMHWEQQHSVPTPSTRGQYLSSPKPYFLWSPDSNPLTSEHQGHLVNKPVCTSITARSRHELTHGWCACRPAVEFDLWWFSPHFTNDNVYFPRARSSMLSLSSKRRT